MIKQTKKQDDKDSLQIKVNELSKKVDDITKSKNGYKDKCQEMKDSIKKLEKDKRDKDSSLRKIKEEKSKLETDLKNEGKKCQELLENLNTVRDDLRGQSNENMDFYFFSDLDSKTSKVMKKIFFCPSPYVKWCPRAPFLTRRKTGKNLKISRKFSF